MKPRRATVFGSFFKKNKQSVLRSVDIYVCDVGGFVGEPTEAGESLRAIGVRWRFKNLEVDVHIGKSRLYLIVK
jgi:hypothetical protein